MRAEDQKLEYRINQMRERLILIAQEKGLNSDDTIYYSQKLDELITKYQKLKMRTTQMVASKSSNVTG